jgi:membrane protease subunit (stomatin/prohibitin family)
LIVTLRSFGEYSLKVVSPQNLVLNLTGTVDVSDNEAIVSWVNQQLLKVLREAITTKLIGGEWAILGVSSHLSEIEQMALGLASAQLEHYGIAIARMGNLDVNLSDEDMATLKKLASDVAYTHLAGTFGEAARAQALQGAGKGMENGDGSSAPLLIAGMGLGAQIAGPGSPAGAPAPAEGGFPGGGKGFAAAAAAGSVFCTNCGESVAASAKFCAGCGTKAPGHTVCAGCQAPLVAGAKFCAECGSAA